MTEENSMNDLDAQKEITPEGDASETDVNEQDESVVENDQQQSLLEQITLLETKLAEQTDLALRTRAEFENFRRRAQEDVEAAHKFAVNKFVTSILPVKDNLEMALADQSGQFDNLKFGVELTLKEFQSAFNNAHIEAIEPMGEKLDPHFHQAMQTEETDDVEPNTIVRVLKKGYKISERLLRPALVVVSVPKSQSE
jgi:molecular chaperone GrpE